MSIEKQGGLEVPSQLETSEKEKQIEQVRRKYLEAMAVAIDANPLTAHLSTEALLAARQELASIDFSAGGNRNEIDPETAKKIEAIGQWYLFGSPQANQLKFTVGAMVLSLLKNSPDSGYFTNLKDWVNKWTDGDGGNKFDEVLSRKEK